MEFNEVIKAIRTEAYLNPLGCNPKRAYFHEDGSPCCVIGKALNRVGISFEQFGSHRNQYSVSAVNWASIGVEKPTSSQKRWAQAVQNAADVKDAWVLAVAKADASMV